MKKIFLLLVCISLLLTACSSNDVQGGNDKVKTDVVISDNQESVVKADVVESDNQDSEVKTAVVESDDQESEVKTAVVESDDQESGVKADVVESDDQDSGVKTGVVKSGNQDSKVIAYWKGPGWYSVFSYNERGELVSVIEADENEVYYKKDYIFGDHGKLKSISIEDKYGCDMTVYFDINGDIESVKTQDEIDTKVTGSKSIAYGTSDSSAFIEFYENGQYKLIRYYNSSIDSQSDSTLRLEIEYDEDGRMTVRKNIFDNSLMYYKYEREGDIVWVSYSTDGEVYTLNSKIIYAPLSKILSGNLIDGNPLILKTLEFDCEKACGIVTDFLSAVAAGDYGRMLNLYDDTILYVSETGINKKDLSFECDGYSGKSEYTYVEPTKMTAGALNEFFDENEISRIKEIFWFLPEDYGIICVDTDAAFDGPRSGAGDFFFVLSVTPNGELAVLCNFANSCWAEAK